MPRFRALRCFRARERALRVARRAVLVVASMCHFTCQSNESKHLAHENGQNMISTLFPICTICTLNWFSINDIVSKEEAEWLTATIDLNYSDG